MKNYKEIVEAIGGVPALFPLIPIRNQQEAADLYKNDKYFNNVPLKYWDASHDIIASRMVAAGYSSVSLSDTVCVLKTAAEMWALQNDEVEPQHYEVMIHYDVWGNPRDGWDVNQSSMYCGLLTVPADADDKRLLQELKKKGILEKHCRLNMFYFDDMGDVIFINRRNGKPILTLTPIMEG